MRHKGLAHLPRTTRRVCARAHGELEQGCFVPGTRQDLGHFNARGRIVSGMLTPISLASRRRAKNSPLAGGSAGDIWPVAALLWVASAARVVLGFAEHEVFGAEGTLALACLVLIPWFLWSDFRSNRAR